MGIAFEPVVVSAAVCGDAWWADALVSPEDAVVTGWTAPRELTVYGNEIVEFAPATGSVVRRWSVSAALDVCATATYETLSKNPDWTHVNSFDASGVFGTGHANNNEIVVSSFFFSNDALRYMCLCQTIPSIWPLIFSMTFNPSWLFSL